MWIELLMKDCYLPSKISRVSYKFNFLWARMDSNHRPGGYEPHALPLSYGPQACVNYIIRAYCVAALWGLPCMGGSRAAHTGTSHIVEFIQVHLATGMGLP